MNEKDLETLIGRIKKQSFSSNKMDELKMSMKYYNLNCDQARSLVAAFTFNGDQEEACILMYPKLTDKHNVNIMFDGLTYQLSKKDIMKKLGI